jgi:hypothetical protein
MNHLGLGAGLGLALALAGARPVGWCDFGSASVCATPAVPMARLPVSASAPGASVGPLRAYAFTQPSAGAGPVVLAAGSQTNDPYACVGLDDYTCVTNGPEGNSVCRSGDALTCDEVQSMCTNDCPAYVKAFSDQCDSCFGPLQ